MMRDGAVTGGRAEPSAAVCVLGGCNPFNEHPILAYEQI